MTIELAKKAAAAKAASLIEEGMTVGLGTGTTALYFIDALAERCKKGLKVKTVASSERSAAQARQGGIDVSGIDAVSSIDITVDGADEIDPQKRMIKGGGGALLREKIVASMSREMIVIVDETKLVLKLGKAKLPLEIVPFGHAATIGRLKRLGFPGTLRGGADPFITDNGNYICDVQLDPDKVRLPEDHERLVQIPGVIETGFFIDLAGRVVVGFSDGETKIQ